MPLTTTAAFRTNRPKYPPNCRHLFLSELAFEFVVNQDFPEHPGKEHIMKNVTRRSLLATGRYPTSRPTGKPASASGLKAIWFTT
jgi:hypothetical protein